VVSVESPLVVSYLTSIASNIVSITVFEIHDAEVLWPGSRTVQGHPRSKVLVPIVGNRWAIGDFLFDYY